MKNKKAQTAIDGLQAIIPVLVAVGIVLVIGFLIFAQVKTQAIDLESVSGTASNEIVAYTNGTVTALLMTPHAMTLSCSTVYNMSPAVAMEQVSPNDYTCDRFGIIMSDNGTLNSTHMNVTYSYKNASRAFNATGELQNATQEIPGWISIIIIVIVGSILLTLVSIFRNK